MSLCVLVGSLACTRRSLGVCPCVCAPVCLAGVDYSAANNVDKLRDLVRASRADGAPAPAVDPQPPSTTIDDAPASTSADDASASTTADDTSASTNDDSDLASMGRLQLIKLCRQRGIDYSAVYKEEDKLRALLEADMSSNGENNVATSSIVEQETASESMAAPVASGSRNDDGEIVNITIHKNGGKVGLGINSLEAGKQLYVTKLKEGALGAAAGIQLGWALMSVNGTVGLVPGTMSLCLAP